MKVRGRASWCGDPVEGGILHLIAWNWHDVSYLNSPPYPELVALLIALPAVAFIGGWLAGRTPRNIAHRPLD